MRSRADFLQDLADAVNELTEPRTHTEYLEHTTVESLEVNGGRRRKAKRTRQRRRHVTTQPPLLDQLRAAAVPGSAETGSVKGGFESSPSAELEPLSVLCEIQEDAGKWSRRLGIERDTLAGVLHGLISARHSDDQLHALTRQAQRWVRRARVATGFDPAPITMDQPCPYCAARNALIIAGDLQSARCSRCGVEWSPDVIGLLADMVQANETAETMPMLRCWMADCVRRGPHDDHEDGRGRTWKRESRCVELVEG